MISEKFIVQGILAPATGTSKMGATSLYIAYSNDPELFDRTGFLGIAPGDVLYLQSAGGHVRFNNFKMRVMGGIPPDLSMKIGPHWHTTDIALPIGLYWPLGVHCNISNVPFADTTDTMLTYKFPTGQEKKFPPTSPPLWDYKGQFNKIPDESARNFYKNYMLSTYAIDIDNLPAWILPSDPEPAPIKIINESEPLLTYVWNSETQTVDTAKLPEPKPVEKTELVEPIFPDTEPTYYETDYQLTDTAIPEPAGTENIVLPETVIPAAKPKYTWLKYAAIAIIGILIVRRILK